MFQTCEYKDIVHLYHGTVKYISRTVSSFTDVLRVTAFMIDEGTAFNSRPANWDKRDFGAVPMTPLITERTRRGRTFRL